jgi:hypothetical protein
MTETSVLKYEVEIAIYERARRQNERKCYNESTMHAATTRIYDENFRLERTNLTLIHKGETMDASY